MYPRQAGQAFLPKMVLDMIKIKTHNDINETTTHSIQIEELSSPIQYITTPGSESSVKVLLEPVIVTLNDEGIEISE